MSGVKMHRRGTGTVAALGIALAASIFSARSASAALLTLDDVTLPGDPVLVDCGAD